MCGKQHEGRSPVQGCGTDRSFGRVSEQASLHLLGAIRIDGGREPMLLRGSQASLLLTFLALDPERPVPVEDLAAVLWPEQLGEHWRGALRGVAAKVRTFLGPLASKEAAVVCHRGSYSFACADADVVDVFRAEHLEAAARHALETGDLPCAATSAGQAAAILAEPLLPGVAADWLDPRRAHLGSTCRRAYRTAARAWSSLHRYEAATVAAEAAIDADPFDEASQRTLLDVHLAAGNRAAGLRAYERFRRLIDEELGVVPDERTQALYVQLLGPPPA
jgi:DNA-binding SARP family transcriptional activator